MATAILMTIWFLTIIGATVVLNFVYDLVDEVLGKRKRARAAEAFELKCREAEVMADIDMLKKKIEWKERDLEIKNRMEQIKSDLNKAIEIYKELEPNEEANSEDKD